MGYVFLILIMTFIGANASLFLKKASGSDGIIDILKNKALYLGLGLYGVAALMNVYVLRFLDYSIVLPLTSLTYVWTMIVSNIVLHEKITKKKIIGLIAVVIGAIFIAL